MCGQPVGRDEPAPGHTDPVTVEPLTPGGVAARLAELVLRRATGLDRRTQAGARHLRVLLDGAPPTGPAALADRLVDPLRAQGRPVIRVHAADFLRPASVRLEHGRHDTDALLDDWLDTRALNREVLAPLGAAAHEPAHAGPEPAPHTTTTARGTTTPAPARYLPTLWDPVLDRATRAAYAEVPPGAVLLLDGSLLLGRGLAADLTVHLAVRPSTLDRRTAPDDAWALPAYARYDAEVRPQDVADVVVRVDDPRHPAWVRPAGPA